MRWTGTSWYVFVLFLSRVKHLLVDPDRSFVVSVLVVFLSSSHLCPESLYRHCKNLFNHIEE